MMNIKKCLKTIFFSITLLICLSACSMKYRISFDDGEKVTYQDVIEGDKANLYIPEREGYKFLGWLDENDELFNFDVPITKNINLHASYEMKEWTIKFVIDSDDESKNIEEKVNTNYYVHKPADPVKEDYIFMGWVYNGELFDFHTKVVSDMVIRADFVLDSTYTPKLNISLNSLNGGDFEKISVRRLEKIGSLPTPTRDGYDFIGWFYKDELISEDYVITQIEDFTISARYQKLN